MPDIAMMLSGESPGRPCDFADQLPAIVADALIGAPPEDHRILVPGDP
jgi:hypothetical protein